MIKEATHLSVEEEIRFRVLIGRFSEKCPVQPLNMFNLDLKMAAKFTALVFTYIFVLIKLKIAD